MLTIRLAPTAASSKPLILNSIAIEVQIATRCRLVLSFPCSLPAGRNLAIFPNGPFTSRQKTPVKYGKDGNSAGHTRAAHHRQAGRRGRNVFRLLPAHCAPLRLPHRTLSSEEKFFAAWERGNRARSMLILLDHRGRTWSSETFAAMAATRTGSRHSTVHFCRWTGGWLVGSSAAGSHYASRLAGVVAGSDDVAARAGCGRARGTNLSRLHHRRRTSLSLRTLRHECSLWPLALS